MDHSGYRRRRTGLGLVAVLFGLFFTAAAVGAVDTATMDFEPERVVKGNRFTLQIRTSIPWGEEVVIDRPELQGPMVWWAYPYARPWTATGEDGSSVRMIEVLAAIRVDAPGFHMIESFGVKAGDREAFSPRKEIIGLEPDEADLPYPVFTEWRTKPETLWQGQAVPVVLEATNLSSLALADTVVLNAAPQGLLEDAPGLGGIITRPHGNDILYDVPMASWIWTLSEPGSYNFPGVRMTISDLNRATPGFQVEVLPLPEAALDSGAVGRFRLSIEIEDGPYNVGEIVSVRVRVEGEGNINVLNPPVPEFDGASLVGQGSSSSYLPGPLGFEGWREERYDYQVEQAGRQELHIPAWTWFDPDGNGRISRQASDVLELNVDETPTDEAAEEKAVLLGSDAFRYRSALFQWRNTYWFLLALPGFILLVILFLLRGPGYRGAAAAIVLPVMLSASSVDLDFGSRASDAAILGEAGSWEVAETVYLSLLADTGEEPGLLHDLSIVSMELGKPDISVALMRRALHLKPGSLRFSHTLEILENRLSLDDQVPVPLRWPPAIIFALLLLSINAVFLVAVRLLFRREAREVILLLSALLLLAASVFLTLYTDGIWKRSTAVVTADADPLRKIPGPLATDWIQLPAGSAVAVVAEEGADVLVKTGYGLEGWLPKTSVILIPEAPDGF